MEIGRWCAHFSCPTPISVKESDHEDQLNKLAACGFALKHLGPIHSSEENLDFLQRNQSDSKSFLQGIAAPNLPLQESYSRYVRKSSSVIMNGCLLSGNEPWSFIILGCCVVGMSCCDSTD